MIEVSTGEKRHTISKDNFDIMLDVPESRADEVHKIIMDHQDWKVNGDHYELLENTMNVKHEMHPDGIPLFYYHMKQKSKPKALVFTFHGFGASQRIDCSLLSTTFANDHHFEVVGMEQETHGRNEPKRENRAFVKDWQIMASNGMAFLEQFLEQEKERLEGVPIFIWGMSMGGGLVTSIMCNKKFKKTTDKIAGAIINAPAIVPTDKPNWLVFQGLVLASSLFPTYLFGGNAPPLKITHYEGFTEWCMNHPESFFGGVKLAMGREIVRIGEFCKKNVSNFHHPALLFHGTKDNMCRYKDSVQYFKKMPSKVKSLVRLKNMLHGIMHDRCIVDILDITAQWIHQRLGLEMRVPEKKEKKKTEEEDGESEEEEEEVVVEKKDEEDEEEEVVVVEKKDEESVKEED